MDGVRQSSVEFGGARVGTSHSDAGGVDWRGATPRVRAWVGACPGATPRIGVSEHVRAERLESRCLGAGPGGMIGACPGAAPRVDVSEHVRDHGRLQRHRVGLALHGPVSVEVAGQSQRGRDGCIHSLGDGATGFGCCAFRRPGSRQERRELEPYPTVRARGIPAAASHIWQQSGGWLTRLAVIWWVVWTERNKIIFSEGSPNATSAIGRIASFTEAWTKGLDP
uniref:Uncharacterized protein n=1 Tax=Ananas comosus var. bracteatus TaxID=296719 RepID=A0A6V7PSY0_ANACO|nr:unnamed protein product [Ananas comosus var. bracteatus]